MSNSKQDKKSQQEIMDFALSELGKAFEALREGKQPEISSAVSELTQQMEAVQSKRSKMSEQEIESWAEQLVTKVVKS